MIFNTFGNPNNPPVIIMHGMCQKWEPMYDYMKKLENYYYLIVPGMDGFYDGSKDFTSFADQSRQIEEYVNEHFNGELYGFYGVSQGGLLGCELLSRNKIKVKNAFLDGNYVAHQGLLAGIASSMIFINAKHNGGKLPKIFNISMSLMGLSEEDMDMLRFVYWDASENSIRTNMLENYTYHLDPSIADSDTYIVLCCGSKEPYAKKSHEIIKKYAKNYKEIILDGLGHGQMCYKHSEELCDMIVEEWSKQSPVKNKSIKKSLFDYSDEYIKSSTWKDLAILKFCLCAVGIIIGVCVSPKHKKTALIAALTVFVMTYIPQMAKFFKIVSGKSNKQ